MMSCPNGCGPMDMVQIDKTDEYEAVCPICEHREGPYP